jgi:hypothetical protein
MLAAHVKKIADLPRDLILNIPVIRQIETRNGAIMLTPISRNLVFSIGENMHRARPSTDISVYIYQNSGSVLLFRERKFLANSDPNKKVDPAKNGPAALTRILTFKTEMLKKPFVEPTNRAKVIIYAAYNKQELNLAFKNKKILINEIKDMAPK